MSHLAPWETPRTFYLTNDVRQVIPTYGRMVAWRWVREARTSWGEWRLEGFNTIRIRWSAGETGVSVTLRRDPTDGVWRGQPTKWSDDGTTSPGVDVSVRRVFDSDCDSFR
jgi:hypothetical protein